MIDEDKILALTELANASSPKETLVALHSARVLFGDNLDAYKPLLDSLAGRAQEVQQLRRLAGCDELTGVANRRTYKDALEREVALHNRKDTGLSVILLDMDGLKELNDTHGHAAGDEAIIAMSRACEVTLRGTDLLARLGGDEFAIMLPATTDADARAVAERLRMAIESEVVACCNLRVSIGTATAGQPPVTANGLLAIADADLYRDKRGRKEAATPHAA